MQTSSRSAGTVMRPVPPHLPRVHDSPGLCKTDIWQDIVDAAPSEKECLDYWNANIPGERLITPEEVARCCVFLLSEDASCMTGAKIMADLYSEQIDTEWPDGKPPYD